MKKVFFIFLLGLSVGYGENSTIEQTNSNLTDSKNLSYKDLLSSLLNTPNTEGQSSQQPEVQATNNAVDFFSENTQPFNETDPWPKQ